MSTILEVDIVQINHPGYFYLCWLVIFRSRTGLCVVCVKVCDASAANDEGITALHNAICAGHLNISEYLVSCGCDVNAPDNDGWLVHECTKSR